jgi:hypothetical protein
MTCNVVSFSDTGNLSRMYERSTDVCSFSNFINIHLSRSFIHTHTHTHTRARARLLMQLNLVEINLTFVCFKHVFAHMLYKDIASSSN